MARLTCRLWALLRRCVACPAAQGSALRSALRSVQRSVQRSALGSGQSRKAPARLPPPGGETRPVTHPGSGRKASGATQGSRGSAPLITQNPPRPNGNALRRRRPGQVGAAIVPRSADTPDASDTPATPDASCAQHAQHAQHTQRS